MSLLKQVSFTTRRLASISRAMSSQSFVDLTVDRAGIAVLTLQRLPVNSLNLELLQDINKYIDDAEKDKSRGMIITSASQTVFSAGLDISEMYKPDMSRAKTFWRTLQDVWLKLYGSKLITAAAVNGHALAAGCLLALVCDYRVMASGGHKIGLNETALGMIAPVWFKDTLCQLIPQRQAEYALVTGKTFSVVDALKMGLIDECAKDKTEAITKCKKFISELDEIPYFPRTMTKQRIRNGPINRLLEKREEDLAEFLGHLQNPIFQQAVELQYKALKKRNDV